MKKYKIIYMCGNKYSFNIFTERIFLLKDAIISLITNMIT